jgi:hypothetical protein
MTKEDHEKHVLEIVQEYFDSKQIKFNLPWIEKQPTFRNNIGAVKSVIELDDPKRYLSVTTTNPFNDRMDTRDGLKIAAFFCIGEEHPKKEIIKLLMDAHKKVDKQEVFEALDLLFHVESEGSKNESQRPD